MREIEIRPIPLARLAELLAPERAERLAHYAEHARTLLDGRTVWSVNATARGGGVAEMLTSLLAYGRGAGVDTRWLVLSADAEFFATTKRLHNFLHGSPGDGGELGMAERDHYVAVLQDNLNMMSSVVKPGDIVLVHDPQPAGMVRGLQARGCHVAWRCHIGRDDRNKYTDAGWEFLRPFVEPADWYILSRPQYAPPWMPPEQVYVIPPSLDPFSAKNTDLTESQVAAALRMADLVDVPLDHGSLNFVRRDGTPGSVRKHEGLAIGDGPVPGDARVVLQVSRWDRLKDMDGVLTGFADYIAELPEDVHLMLVGPDVSGVSDDPEGAEVLAECTALWKDLPRPVRERIHLVCLPMDDVDENAHLVNALQSHASVVVQKSLVEGFGLTVTEPMWKGRPVVASAVGGIQDQISDGVDGLLLPDPRDLAAFAKAVGRLLDDEDLAASLGTAARERVRNEFLGDRHLIQYVDLFQKMIDAEPAT